MSSARTDRIELKIFMRAPRSRVWRALTDSREFGAWFGVTATSTFTPGARIHVPVSDDFAEEASWA